MGKVVRFTGSRALGTELRRLRGGRTLGEIASLSRLKLGSIGFRGVSVGTLSDIENGKSLPNVESIFALSVLYQVPPARFLHALLEENLTAEFAALADDADIPSRHAASVLKGDFVEALALAAAALKASVEPWETVRWRINKAIAMERLGMRFDAITELNACLADEGMRDTERYKVHRELARMHLYAHQLDLAELHLDQAFRGAPEDCPPLLRSRLLETRLRLGVTRLQDLPASAASSLAHELSAIVRECRLLIRREDHGDRLALDLYEGRTLQHLGDARGARRAYRRVEAASRDLNLPLRRVEALTCLATLERKSKPEVAVKLMSDAATEAIDGNHIDHAFVACFHLADWADTAEARGHWLKKCRRLYPFVNGVTPLVRKFERFGTSGEA